MEFRLIGPVEVLVDGRPVDAGPPQRRAVLAALLVDAGRVVMPHALVERVWGAQPPEGVRQALYAHIARLRRLLVEVPVACGEQPLPLSRRSGGYLLDIDPNSVDMRRFQWLVRRSREAGCDSTERSVALREALDLWRGEPLDGVAGQWAERMRVGWRRQHVEAVLAWARGELDADNAAAAIARLTDLAEEHPLHEPAVAALMAALHGAGLTAEALRRYSVLRRRLIDELGVDPGSQLRELHQRILRGH